MYFKDTVCLEELFLRLEARVWIIFFEAKTSETFAECFKQKFRGPIIAGRLIFWIRSSKSKMCNKFFKLIFSKFSYFFSNFFQIFQNLFNFYSCLKKIFTIFYFNFFNFVNLIQHNSVFSRQLCRFSSHLVDGPRLLGVTTISTHITRGGKPVLTHQYTVSDIGHIIFYLIYYHIHIICQKNYIQSFISYRKIHICQYKTYNMDTSTFIL
jgi:hypothetical protein